MSGSVWEWLADDYDNPGQHRPGAARRVVRGGSWAGDAPFCRVSSEEIPAWLGYRNVDLGLRFIRPLN